MSIKLTLGDAIRARAAIQKLPQGVPFKVSYRLGRIAREIKREEDTYIEARDELTKQLGALQNDGSYKIEGEKRVEWETKTNELLKEEIELSLNKIKLDAIEGANPEKTPDIAPGLMEAILPLIDDADGD